MFLVNYILRETNKMPTTCSHCGMIGHNYRGCPTITPEEKQKKIQENKEKKEAARLRRELRDQRLAQRERERLAREEERERIQRERDLQRQRRQKYFKPYNFLNPNDYEVALYWGFIPTQKNLSETRMHSFKMLSYIPSFGESPTRLDYRKHMIVVFPILEVSDSNGNAYSEVFGEVPLSDDEDIFESWECDLSNIKFERTIQWSTRNRRRPLPGEAKTIYCGKVPENTGNETEFFHLPKLEYKPLKSELDQWKECAFKSYYLLNQLIMLGAKKDENLEPILDMVEDIQVPKHTEYDKEFAGVPSTLTNIT
jgi:hypothetical protein